MKTIFCLLILSSFTLGIGILAPTMQTEPRLTLYDGDYTEIMNLLFPEEFKTSSYSIIEGIQHMWSAGSKGIASLIFAFSVVFPILKILILWLASLKLTEAKCPGKSLKLVEKLGKFSMIDVFVISVLIVTVKGLPGGSQIHAAWGLYIFAISVILSIIAGYMLAHRAHEIELTDTQNKT
ncbi:MAG: paraquat-inducible protein A [Akkermansiaceae bacterium]